MLTVDLSWQHRGKSAPNRFCHVRFTFWAREKTEMVPERRELFYNFAILCVKGLSYLNERKTERCALKCWRNI